MPALLGRCQPQPSHEFLYWEFHEGGFKQAALYQGRWKGLRQRSTSAPLALYDLQSDIGEQRDLAVQLPDLVARLEAYLNTARTDSPDWPANNPLLHRRTLPTFLSPLPRSSLRLRRASRKTPHASAANTPTANPRPIV